VGRVGNRRVDMEDTIERSVDPRGRVSMLVQDRRTKNLVYVNVQLERAGHRPVPTPRLTGTVTYRERMAIPVGAELVVRIRERGLLGSRVVAEHRTKIFQQPPFRFQLVVEEGEFDPHDRYEVEAELIERGRTTFESDRVEVLTNGNPNWVDLLLRPR
jgi:putative lipoprotein